MDDLLSNYVVVPADVVSQDRAVEPTGHALEWVAIPARWQDDGWEATLDLTEPPDGVVACQRDGWRTVTRHDVPSGFYPVSLHIRRQRWRLPDGRRVLSPMPAALGGGTEGTPTQRGRPTVPSSTPALRAFQHNANAALPAGAALIRQRVAVASAHLPAAHAPRQWITHRLDVPPEHLALDELWVAQTSEGGSNVSKTYWTVVTNNAPGRASPGSRVLGLCQGRRPEDLAPMLAEIARWYPPGGGPAYVSLDMWRDYRYAVTTVFPNALILFDRFHFERHIENDWQFAWDDCTSELPAWQREALKRCPGWPCTCRLGQVCQRWQNATRLYTHLRTLWTLRSSAEAMRFLSRWNRLAVRCEDFQKTTYLLSQWQDAVVNMAVLRGSAGNMSGTASAERANRELRQTIRLHGLSPLETWLERLMAILHTEVPGSRDVVARPLADGLVCPTCGTSGTDVTAAPGSTWRAVRHVPRGFDPVTLVLPSAVMCQSCASTQAQPPVSTALTWWLQQPSQLALSQAQLAELSGLSSRAVSQRVNALLESLPADRVLPTVDIVVYSEIWTASRVWLVLSTPPGRVIELVPVALRANGADQAEAAPVHVRVAWAARELVEPYMKPAGTLLYLTVQTGELGRELKPWIDAKRVRLKPFVALSLVRRYQRQARPIVTDFNTAFGTSLSVDPRTAPVPADWDLLTCQDPALAQVLRDLSELDRAIISKSADQVGLIDLTVTGSRPRWYGTSGADLHSRVWAAWSLWLPVIRSSLATQVNTGYEPQLMRRIRDHLHTSPALTPERQRRRLLLLLAEELRVRQEARR